MIHRILLAVGTHDLIYNHHDSYITIVDLVHSKHDTLISRRKHQLVYIILELL